MAGWDFHDDKSRFYYERSKVSWWQVKVFMMIGRDFITKSRDFHEVKQRFSLSFSYGLNKGDDMMMMMLMMMIINNCFCGMVNRRKVLSLSWDNCQRSSPSWTSSTSPARFKPAQKLSSSFVDSSCAEVISTT